MNKKINEYKIGQKAIYTRKITEKDVEDFAKLSGDRNPIHFNEEYASNTIFKGKIVHGLLSATFISNVLANELPGPGTIYLKQTLEFIKPVRIGDEITTRVEIIEINKEKNIIILSTMCINQNKIAVIKGIAITMLLSKEQ